MAAVLPPPKVVLLAAHFTATGAIASLASLTAQNGDVLRLELVLRLLLTYLPARLPTAEYLALLESLDADDFSTFFPLAELDSSSVNGFSDAQAVKRVRKLRLRPLDLPGDLLPGDLPGKRGSTAKTATTTGPTDDGDGDGENDRDPLAAFLILRAHAVDDGAGALPELPALVAPFLDRHGQRLRTWAVSTLLPLLRRNCEFYPDRPLAQTLADFEQLPDRLAVSRLLSQTGAVVVGTSRSEEQDRLASVGRDLRGLIGPWLYSERRWTSRSGKTAETATEPADEDGSLCPGWEEVLRWLATQAAQPTSWRVAVAAVTQWDGPGDADLGGFGTLWLDEDEQEYLERRYARAALAVVYLIPEASADALSSAGDVVAKMRSLLDLDVAPDAASAASLLPPVAANVVARTLSASASASAAADITATTPAASSFLRSDLLSETNALTRPSPAATELLQALVLSAHLLTSRLGCPCSVRQAAELALLLRGAHEQQAVAAKAIRWVAANGPKGEDKFWIKARNEILWLRDWGADEEEDDEEERERADSQTQTSSSPAQGIFGHVPRDFIEVEFLKALLANTRYSLARALYEDTPDRPLSEKLVQDTVFAAAMSAYDNASNPNRTRGGLKKCADIIHAFPKTINKSLPAAQQAEALIAATHALSTYRLVLKQGEPFTPVVLRVHPDPISILGKVLEQNPKSYTQVHALVDVAVSMVDAGLAVPEEGGRNSAGRSHSRSTTARASVSPETAAAVQRARRAMVERRVTAMCIDAALNEDDFETAYSFVMGQLATADGASVPALVGQADVWSWRAALEAGKYRRTERTVRPTHLGTASANLEIRHLEQRIECLATALRIAPADTLQEILNSYRRCEEELEAAVLAEAEQEAAWDTKADWRLRQKQQQQQQQQQRQHPRTSSPASMPGGFERPQHTPPAGTPLASRAAAAAAAAASSSPSSSSFHHYYAQQQPQTAATADDTPLSLFDLSRATARVAQRNLAALSSLRQTRQTVFGGGGGPREATPAAAPLAAAAVDGDNAAPHLRKRDQLREAAMGTLTSGVGWLIGAQPVDRGSERD